MDITISQPAIKWFINEMNLSEGDYIRFFVRYGGHGGAQVGFSLGVSNQDEPFEPVTKTTIDGITFFVEKKDEWYFDGSDLHIKYSRKKEEIEFLLQ
ncbi:HesB/YadR/YfhF family protein [Amphibacillus cookii]|uniref:HesB/YadR/YfhF family protein n=1 Tax=Amphibacillus cookii TaxID=767787 RepID=UPI00195A0C4A|nr:HesB/YadR/YfhF family protein [Amphibacillus cookii]MBM7540967.1 uncharacterized protein YneR [Amphibacillus cookii]